jgi:hypothetical protein
MKKLIIVLSLLLNGCLYQEVSSVDIEKANDFCKNNQSSVEYIHANMFGGEITKCLNGKQIWLDDYKYGKNHE